eukprot:6194311-Amphidinium_carterae.2
MKKRNANVTKSRFPEVQKAHAESQCFTAPPKSNDFKETEEVDHTTVTFASSRTLSNAGRVVNVWGTSFVPPKFSWRRWST